MNEILRREFGEFTCPMCGSNFFRTTNTRTMERACKGHFDEYLGYTGCGFTFSSEDAHLYGLKNPEHPVILHVSGCGVGEKRIDNKKR